MLKIKYVARVVCERNYVRGDGTEVSCVESEEFVHPARNMPLETFEGLAREYFKQLGWKIGECPACPDCVTSCKPKVRA